MDARKKGYRPKPVTVQTLNNPLTEMYDPVPHSDAQPLPLSTSLVTVAQTNMDQVMQEGGML